MTNCICKNIADDESVNMIKILQIKIYESSRTLRIIEFQLYIINYILLIILRESSRNYSTKYSSGDYERIYGRVTL